MGNRRHRFVARKKKSGHSVNTDYTQWVDIVFEVNSISNLHNIAVSRDTYETFILQQYENWNNISWKCVKMRLRLQKCSAPILRICGGCWHHRKLIHVGVIIVAFKSIHVEDLEFCSRCGSIWWIIDDDRVLKNYSNVNLLHFSN